MIILKGFDKIPVGSETIIRIHVSSSQRNSIVFGWDPSLVCFVRLNYRGAHSIPGFGILWSSLGFLAILGGNEFSLQNPRRHSLSSGAMGTKGSATL